ncbi:GntR family transcriptional regulator [Amycolatopsis rubida]|uniref:DNA-binding transcriptional regulator, GntR family n=1 Tax=Amycolatopsis rubida TaxID=112413 RepID=A0A1I5ZKU3_9PSEU|nr:GntR family transcriptional regulator [Amycolatopsis rubida]MYW91584.1 FCD domain-containing protein [Amycolatopsis rubida]NEC56569.1 GntR family transcriptional regulator [Amycolatopsis rubida]SFQ57065.1 DNA-binding transcriptional regulator, GntR family [Amycolatopsis rubida]
MLDVSALPKVSRSLLRDEAYERIRHAIIDGSLPPGTPLRDADLAEQLGLSRAPVRQALLRLAEDRLVVSKPQSYTRVAEFDAGDVRDAVRLVRALHELVVREARLGTEQIAEMREANDRFRSAVAEGDVGKAIEADDEVHDIPVRACGNRAVAATLDRYTPLLRRLEYARFSSLPAHRSVARHEELIAALESGDEKTAAQLTSTIWTDLEALLEDA